MEGQNIYNACNKTNWIFAIQYNVVVVHQIYPSSIKQSKLIDKTSVILRKTSLIGIAVYAWKNGAFVQDGLQILNL